MRGDWRAGRDSNSHPIDLESADLSEQSDLARDNREWGKRSELFSQVEELKAERERLRGRWREAAREAAAARTGVSKARQESYTRLLAQVRPVGGGFDAKTAFAPRSSVAGKKIVQAVSRLYPTDWNRAFSGPANNQVKVALVKGCDGRAAWRVRVLSASGHVV